MSICGNIIEKYREFKHNIIAYLCIKEGILMPNIEKSNIEKNQLVLIDASDKYRIDVKIDELKNQYPELKKVNFDLISFLKSQYDFTILEVPLEDDTTGYILVDEKNLLNFTNFITHRLIVTNESLFKYINYLQKRRFIIAHEFGHYILHKHNSQIQFAKRDTEHFNTKEEQEAEYFARSLLMPKSEVFQSINTIESLSIAQKVEVIKETFNVTENKARYRLQELGLI